MSADEKQLLELLARDVAFQPSLKDSMPNIVIRLWQPGGASYEELEWDGAFPFLTIEDIKQFIFTSMYTRSPEEGMKWLPKCTFLAYPLGGDDEVEPGPGLRYLAADYLWYPGQATKPENVIIMASPVDMLEGVDRRFIDSLGNFANLGRTRHSRSTIEEIFLKPRDGEIPVLHAYALADILTEFTGPKPITNTDWNGRFAAYYPDIPLEGPYEGLPEDEGYARTILSFFNKRREHLETVESALESIEPQDLNKLRIDGVQYLRLEWPYIVSDFEGCEAFFYRLATSKVRPFIRMIPARGSAISKLHVRGGVVPIPDLPDPMLLQQWSRERSPTPGRDFVLAKVRIREAVAGRPPVFMTFRFFDDGSADLLVLPPKQVALLDPVLDIGPLTSALQGMYKDTHIEGERVLLADATIRMTISLPLGRHILAATDLRQILTVFAPFFQEINSLPGEKPLIMLRYKAVSRFANKNKIFSFLSQLHSRRIVDDDAVLASYKAAIMDEFNLLEPEARKFVSDWWLDREAFVVEAPEKGTFSEAYNPGIDVAIFAAHQQYKINLYRIDSVESLQRIYTLLTLMLSASKADLGLNVEEESTTEREAAALYTRAEEALAAEVLRREVSNDAPALNEEAPKPTAADELALPGPGAAGTDDVPASLMGDFSDMFDMMGFASDAPTLDAAPSIAQLLASTAPITTAAPETLKIKRTKPAAAPPAMNEVGPAQAAAPAMPAKGKPDGVVANKWFIKRLEAYDPALFKYKPRIGTRGYASKCAANIDQQPLVLNEDQYRLMREIYKDDDDLIWIEYPLQGSEPKPAPSQEENTIRVLKFGTNPANMNYYTCASLICLRDQIIIRERDFASEIDRYKKSKPRDSCPFCHGLEISKVQELRAVEGHTVFRRMIKPRGVIPHKYIGFLKDADHPDNHPVPCCYVSEKTLHLSDPQFMQVRDYIKAGERQLAAAAAPDGIDEDEDAGDAGASLAGDLESELSVALEGQAVEYAAARDKIHRKYIVEANKYPLGIILESKKGEPPHVYPRFGMLATGLDLYFLQDSTSLVSRAAIRLDLNPTAKGFLRMGVDTSTKNESLLAALAPILYKSTTDQVRQRLIEVYTPRVFLHSHYGNLVLEFFDPSYPEPTDNELRSWASQELQVDINSVNRFSVSRIYRAWQAFAGQPTEGMPLSFLYDSTRRKELRHLTPVLAEPGLITPRGIHLIVLQYGSDPAHQMEMPVINCPVQGVNLDRHERCDIVFITRDKDGLFELLLYTDNEPKSGALPERHDTTIIFQRAARPAWPQIVRQRVDEFFKLCAGPGHAAATSQIGINPKALVPMAAAIAAHPNFPNGIIRDAYNHAVALTYPIPGRSSLVALPVIDDGSQPLQLRIHLDWLDYKPATMQEIIQYYKTTLEPILGFYPGYEVKYVVRKRGGNFNAIQLANGIYIPAAEARDRTGVPAEIPTVEVDEYLWDINRDIVQSIDDDDPKLSLKSTRSQLEELYQHFRLSVAGWFNSRGAGKQLLKTVENTIFRNDLPTWEKRKRLEITIGSTLRSWMQEEEDLIVPPTFLRRDCRRIIDAGSCNGACVWMNASGLSGTAGAQEGRCLLHVPATAELGSHNVSTANLFIRRTIDELIFFPILSKQLRSNTVPRMTSLRGSKQIGNTLIVPESSPTWIQLLQMEWMKTTMERPRYIEELSAEPGAGEMKREGIKSVPAALWGPLGIDETSDLRLWMARQTPEFLAQPMLPLTTILEMSLDQLGLDADAKGLSEDAGRAYTKAQKRPIIIVNTDGTIRAYRPFKGKYDRILVVINTEDGPGLLVFGDSNKTQMLMSQLPAPLLTAYETAEVVLRIAAAAAAEEPAAAAVPTLRIKRAKPLTAIPEVSELEISPAALGEEAGANVAAAPSEPLVQAIPEEVAAPIIPQVAINPEAVSRTMGVPKENAPQAVQKLRIKRAKAAPPV